MSEHVVGYGGMWAPPGEDPRAFDVAEGELATIRGYLTSYRLTLGLKCEGLDAEQLARRSVPPSTMSLLGLVRHMAAVEHHWFQRSLQGRHDVQHPFWSTGDSDFDFNGAIAEDTVVTEAFEAWREQIALADAWLDHVTDLGALVRTPRGQETSVRDVLVHMVEEYARHCGHADLLRECVDGRTGQ